MNVNGPRLDIETFGHASVELIGEQFMPDEYKENYRALAADLLQGVEERFASFPDVRTIRTHGDCHPGNILWRNDIPNLVDLDDARTAPAIQDVWMMLSGDRARQTAQLAEIIDGYNENKSLLTNRKIRDIDPGIIDENNSVTYFNNVEILELSQRLLSALGTMVSMEDREKAKKARIIITEVLNPFIEGLKEFERSCTRSYFAPGMVVIDSKTSIAKKNTRIEAK